MSREKRSSFAQRVAWLKKHPEMKGKPKKEVFRAMQADGLFAKTTYFVDVHLQAEFLAAHFYVE